jgi:hypothetical protein
MRNKRVQTAIHRSSANKLCLENENIAPEVRRKLEESLLDFAHEERLRATPDRNRYLKKRIISANVNQNLKNSDST